MVEFLEEKYHFDTVKYPFKKILEKLFDVDNLEMLHNHLDENGSNLGIKDIGNDSQSKFHDQFYSEIKKIDSDLRQTWDDFLEKVVRNHFIKEEKLITQALPNIRIHIPGSKAIQRWHYDSDKDHNHPKGEINSIVPITNMFDSNSVWRESVPFKGDFKPFVLSEGEVVYWDGNECHHGNKKNKTNITRVSFDFRIMPNNRYEKYLRNFNKNKIKTSATLGTKFLIGSYYKEVN